VTRTETDRNTFKYRFCFIALIAVDAFAALAGAAPASAGIDVNHSENLLHDEH
jgi:hypothetical protein